MEDILSQEEINSLLNVINQNEKNLISSFPNKIKLNDNDIIEV